MTLNPGPNCCIRDINIDYNSTFKASYTARSNYNDPDNYGDINNGNTTVDVNIQDTGSEVDVNTSDGPDLSQDVQDQIMDDYRENPDQWSRDDSYNDSNQGPENAANEHGQENWDEISELTGQSLTSGGEYTHGSGNPYVKDMKLPVNRMSRAAEFCGDTFVRWLNSNGPRL
jgi:hypothetical protein